MANNDLAPAGSLRTPPVDPQGVATLQARTTQRLSPGRMVTGAVDDPSAFCAAPDHTARAANIADRAWLPISFTAVRTRRKQLAGAASGTGTNSRARERDQAQPALRAARES